MAFRDRDRDRDRGRDEKIRNLNLITGERSVDFVQIRFR